MPTTTEDVLPEIVRRLVEEFDPEEIILFGSRAWGQPRPDSDYDLFVIVAESEEHPLQRAVRAHGCLSGLGISKDVIVSTRARFDRFSRVPASLEATIRNRGAVLYGRRQEGVGSTDVYAPREAEILKRGKALSERGPTAAGGLLT